MSLNCYEVKKHLPEYIRGETATINYIGIRIHLEKCQQCSKEFAKEQALNSLMDELKFPMPDIDVSQKVMKSIEDEESSKKEISRQTKKRRLTLVQDLVSAAAVAIIAFSAIFSPMDDLKLPDYSSKISSVSETISSIAESYLNLSTDSIDNLYDREKEKTKVYEKEMNK